jgi:hypothetical protein
MHILKRIVCNKHLNITNYLIFTCFQELTDYMFTEYYINIRIGAELNYFLIEQVYI